MLNIKNTNKIPFELLVIIPALILGLLLWKYGVNCPFMDEWDTPGADLVQFNLGELNFSSLIRQHNESRKFFPRLLFLSLSRNTWNPRDGMVISFLLCCLTTVNIYHLSKFTLKETNAKRLVYLTLASMLIFSPMQWENWLMGLSLIAFVPITAITSALVIIYSRSPLSVKLLGSALLATYATFSFANGIISWIVLFPALYLVADKSRRSIIWVTAGWLLLFGLNAAVYFHNYHRPEGHPSFIDAVKLPIQSLAYYLSFLGSLLGIHKLWLSQILGLGVCLLITLSCWYLFRVDRYRPNALRDNLKDTIRERQLIERVLPWLTIFAYTLISGALTTVGRVGFGVDQSLSSRYVTFSTYGFVSLIYIAAIVVRETSDRSLKTSISDRQVIKYTVTTALVLFALLYPLNVIDGVDAMKMTYRNRLYGKSCLTLINVVRDRECIESYVYPDLSKVFERVNELDRLGLIQPSLILNDRLQNISRDSFSQVKDGSFETLALNKDNTYTASGWSTLPQYKTPAHAVLLAYQTKDRVHHAFAIAKPELDRQDVRQITGKNYRHIGWSKTFPQDLIPPETVSLSAWSFDSNLARAYRLDRIQLISQ